MILVYGGAFNPPTKAHKIIYETLKEMYQPSLFIFLPVGYAYKKPGLIEFHHRKAMLEVMTNHDKNVLVSDFEQTPAFKGSVSALDHYKKQYLEPVKFILGLDNLLDLPNWIEYERLLRENQFIAIDRNGGALEAIKHHYPSYADHFDVVHLDIKTSSTLFRTNPKTHQDMIDKSVLSYIQEHHLYGV